MSDLISRDDLRAELEARWGNPTPSCPRLDYDAAIAAIDAAPAIVPQVVCNISGGLLQGASATHKVDVYSLDFDYDGESPESAVEIDGSEAWLGQDSADVDPEFVNRVITAPYLSEIEECD